MPTRDEGFFSARDNLRLFWESRLPDGEPKAHVAIVHGYGEHLGRYSETMDALVAQGFATHAFDFRGHGRSDGRRGFVNRFPEYVEDLTVFWARVRAAAGGKKTFLLAHSNGALVTIQWLARKPEGIAGLILSAPYLRLAITPAKLKVLVAKLVGRVIPSLPIKTELTYADLTRDEAFQKKTEADPLYLTIVTPRWFNESNAAQLDALKNGGGRIHQPTYVFCGEKDGVANPAAARELFDSIAAADKKFKQYPGMRHETLNELGKEEVVRDLASWISNHL